MATQSLQKSITITDPPAFANFFGNTRWAWLWLIMRVYVGYTWLTSGWGKLSNPGWVGTGEALQAFWSERWQSRKLQLVLPLRLIGIGLSFKPC